MNNIVVNYEGKFTDPNFLYYRPLNFLFNTKYLEYLQNLGVKVIWCYISMFWHSYFFVLPRYFNIIDPYFILTEV